MIYELRQYTLVPGRRDTLIELFEREFVEAQEAVGARVAGSFRVGGAPDRFTWLRSYPSMPARQAALEAFYDGPVWLAHRDAANATLEDSDDVLLLHSVGGEPPSWERPRAAEPPESVYAATVYHVEDGFSAFFAREVAPVLAEAGVPPVACLESEHSANNFPRHPIRTGENVFVWFARFDTAREEREIELPMVTPRLTGPPERILLHPTARSAMR
ncbi:NIPSNAP family protein [Nonomuraea phyllanthi]|uniref:NIPSNAP family protein n=1 Tax=Nonomuraea phyllanthi TaxID=2219224 RepID=A0A5C4V7G4_9ACTN|nr:NIPSNAP family protein [Nonomuraea phyllanthi]KAB8187519.1 NIPSNAP family protein [Nonomuraea phyllanthi]